MTRQVDIQALIPHLNEAQMQALRKQGVHIPGDSTPKPPTASKPKGQSKYSNIRSEADGIKFDSRREMRRYLQLKLLKSSGKIKTFLRQVPFDLPGKTEQGAPIRYLADFVVVHLDGTIEVEDVKGMKTDGYKIKSAQVKEVHGLKIREV